MVMAEDVFERLAARLEGPGDGEAELGRLGARCICPDCPTYTACADERGERLYCFRGRSPECIRDELGCTCPDCPVAAEAGLERLYYCTAGSERELRAGR